jgi:hypothetical protein
MSDVLEDAARVIHGPRRQAYGPVEESFDGIATVLNVVLQEEAGGGVGWAGRGVDDDVAEALQGGKRTFMGQPCGSGGLRGLERPARRVH